jgi:hypothetical protein
MDDQKLEIIPLDKIRTFENNESSFAEVVELVDTPS